MHDTLFGFILGFASVPLLVVLWKILSSLGRVVRFAFRGLSNVPWKFRFRTFCGDAAEALSDEIRGYEVQ